MRSTQTVSYLYIHGKLGKITGQRHFDSDGSRGQAQNKIVRAQPTATQVTP